MQLISSRSKRDRDPSRQVPAAARTVAVPGATSSRGCGIFRGQYSFALLALVLPFVHVSALVQPAGAGARVARLRSVGLLTVRSLRVDGKGGSTGSQIFLGPNGGGFSIGSDATGSKFAISPIQGTEPLLAFGADRSLRLGVDRMEATALSAGGITIRGVKQWQLAHSEDFAQGALGWSKSDVTQCGGVHMLGGFCKLSKGEVNKTFSGLPVHRQLRVVATYHFIDRWIGEAGYLKMNIGQDGAPVTVWSEQHSQQMSKHGVSLCGQDKTPEGKFSAIVDVTVAHEKDVAELIFGSTMDDQDPCDESWGISNLELYVRN